MAEDAKEATLRHVQFLALSQMVISLLAREFARSDNANEMAAEWLNLTELASEKMAFPELPPEWSDIAAQELRDSEIRYILRARALATGEPFDPNAYSQNWRLSPDSNH